MISAVVGVLRAFSPDINWLLLSQFILGVSFACMFVSVAKLAVNWFPRKEGAFAQGIGLISSSAGNMAGLILTPLLIGLFGEFAPLSSLRSTLLLYGIVTVIAAIIFFVLAREAPPTPPDIIEETESVPVRQGLSRIAKSRDYWLLAIAFFIGFGVYISITDYIERMAWSNVPLLQKWAELYVAMYHPEYFFVFIRMEQSTGGLASGLIILTGLIGTVVITRISDRIGRRKLFLILSVFICTPMVYLMCTQVGWILLAAAAVFGFFLLALEPLVFQTMVELKDIGPMLAGLALGIMLTIGHIGSSVVPLIAGSLQTMSGSYMLAELFYSFVILPNYWMSVAANPLYYYLVAAPPLIQLPGTFSSVTLFLVVSTAATIGVVALLKEVV